MYNKILVPLDGSPIGEQTIPYVRILGTALKSPVELLRIFEPPPVYYWPAIANYQERAQAAAQHVEEVLHSLDPIVDSLKAAGISATATVHQPRTQLSEGEEPSHTGTSPAEHIVQVAERDSETLIAMCTHGRSGLGRWVMGSVTDKVLHATTNPILIVRGKEASAPGDVKLDRIIVPWDGSAVAEQIWPHAVALSQAAAVKIHLMTVIPPDRSHTVEEDHLRQMGDRLVQQGAHSYEVSCLDGEPADVIVNMTQEFGDALVAMTTHGRSGVGRWVMGSVTDRVVRHAAGAVLVTRAA